MVRRGFAGFVLALAASAVAGGVAAATVPAAVRAFERGTRELEFGRFSEAAKAFREAIALDGAESGEPVARPSGMNFEAYLPHLGLAVALCEAGELVSAAASSVESARQGEVARGGSRLPGRWRQCESRRRVEARSWAMERIEAARAALAKPPGTVTASELERLRARFDAIGRGDEGATLESWIARGTEAVQVVGAMASLGSTTRVPAGVAPVESLTAATGGTMSTRAPELWSRLEQVGREAARGDRTPILPGWLEEQAAIRSAMTALEASRLRLSPDEVARGESALASRLEKLENDLPESRLPAALFAAAQALFTGDAGAALAALGSFDSPRARARAQAHLLRSAAAFLRLATEGDASGELGRLAIAERRSALAADPTLTPDPRFFSGVFLDFYARGTIAAEPVELRTR